MRSTRLCWTAAALLVALAGCSSTISGTPGAAGDPTGVPAVVSAENQARGEPTAGAVDACALLPAADVKAIVGDGVDGQATPGGDGGKCTWENQTNYYSVTVDIGSTGTAASGLPAWDKALGPERPLPDGMRSWSGGQVEFVGGTRDCFLQVASNGGDADEKKAVELARKVRDQL
jgi:Protein of unknown function (DUF3558)